MTQHVLDVATREADTALFSPRVWAALRGDGGGAWMREATLALALAAQANIRLDEATLIYSDVRDLMALQRALRVAATGSQRAGVVCYPALSDAAMRALA